MDSELDFVEFPSLTQANPDGLLAMGGDLRINTLVSAYAQGIFPWYNEDQPILWWSPDPRMVLFPDQIKVSRSLAKVIRQKKFSISCNRNFREVISACSLRGQDSSSQPLEGTWITTDMIDAYTTLHLRHYAHSIEVWQNSELVGGLYGIAMGQVFFGESMFSRVSNASKVALVTLCQTLSRQGYKVIDCQVANNHLSSLGAREIDREQFINLLQGCDINKPEVDFSSMFDQT